VGDPATPASQSKTEKAHEMEQELFERLKFAPGSIVQTTRTTKETKKTTTWIFDRSQVEKKSVAA
jgi:hypothetical protein